MVLAHHAIFSTYGFWLPNDPRGSWSDFVASWELFKFGPATKTTQRRSLAHTPHDTALRQAAKQALKYPPVIFNDAQIESVARGFAMAAADAGYVLWACAIMPDHVHVVVRRHERETIEQVVQRLKSLATKRLNAEGLHPLARFAKPDGPIPTPWVEGRWKVFLDTDDEISRAIRYVEDNPLKIGLPAQVWPFVVPLNGSAGRPAG